MHKGLRSSYPSLNSCIQLSWPQERTPCSFRPSIQMNKLHAVVLWCDEPSNYSSVRISRVNFDRDTVTDQSQLIDQIYEIRLDKAGTEVYAGKILHVGSRARMSKVAAELASDAADLSFQVEEDVEPNQGSSRVTRRVKERRQKWNSKEKRGPSPDTELNVFTGSEHQNSEESVTNEGEPEQPEDSEHGTGILQAPLEMEIEEAESEAIADEKEKLIQKLRLKLRNRDKRISRLQDDLARLQPKEDEALDIGEGNFVSKELLVELKMEHRHNPGVFLRKLMEKSRIFTLEEMANSSLTGQKHHDGMQRPRLDFKRFTVCKDYTIKKCKVKENTIKMLQFRRSISNICTDARKRLRKNVNVI